MANIKAQQGMVKALEFDLSRRSRSRGRTQATI